MQKKRYIQFFDNESRRYDSTRDFYEGGYGGYRERALLTFFCVAGARVINTACGTGRLLAFLAERSSEVVGIDLSRNMLNIAKKKTRHLDNVHLIRCDAEILPVRDGGSDEIICSRAFKLFPNPLETLKEWRKALRKGGIVIVSVETSDPLWIRIGYWLRLRQMGARFEWRYKSHEVRSLFKTAGLSIHFSGCVIYFGRTIYEAVAEYFEPFLRILGLIDSHSKLGRNIMVVGLRR